MRTIRWMLAVAAIALVAAPQAAHARGTAAGTLVNNSVTLSYSVNKTTQPNATSNTASFTVDQMVDVVVQTLDAAPVSVTPGGTNYVLTFKVTNVGNAKQDFALSATAVAAGGAAKFGGNDTADMANVRVFVDNGDGVFNAAQDTATFIDELPADQYAVVFVVADAPNTLANGKIASYHLTATAHKAGRVGLGGLETQTLPGKQTVTGQDVIFVDGAGTDPNDGPRNGAHSDQSDYKAVSAVISVTKSVAAITDPYGSNAAIPGATVTYQIQVTNAAGAGAPAVLSTITDTLPAQLAPDTTAKAASWTVTGSTTRATTTGTLTLDNGDANNDGLGFTGQQVTFTLTKILPADAANNYAAGELKPGETLTLKFNVIIQ